MKNCTQMKASRRDAPDADQERVRAGASGETRGLGIEERHLTGRAVRNGSGSDRLQQIVRQIAERGDIEAPMTAVRFP